MIKIDKHIKTLEAIRKDVWAQYNKQSIDELAAYDMNRVVLGVHFINTSIKALKDIAQE